jgi:hypothetical protein
MQFWTGMVAVLLSCTVRASGSRAHEVRMAEPSAPTQADDRFPFVKGVRPTLLRAA